MKELENICDEMETLNVEIEMIDRLSELIRRFTTFNNLNDIRVREAYNDVQTISLALSYRLQNAKDIGVKIAEKLIKIR